MVKGYFNLSYIVLKHIFVRCVFIQYREKMFFYTNKNIVNVNIVEKYYGSDYNVDY